MAHRKNILALATKISLESMTYTGITFNDPEYKILEPVITDEMCEIAMHMKLETPRSVEEIAKRAKKPVDYTQARILELRKAGVVRTHYEGDKEYYFYPIWVPGIMEGMLADKNQCEKYPIIGYCFEEYTRRRTAPLASAMCVGTGFMHVMPVQTTIESESKSASYDEISTLVEKAETISVGPCSCRRSRRLMGEGCGHLEEDMCMYLNDSAKNFISLGYHRQVSKAEAYEIIKRAEENGLVHNVNQTNGFDEINAICNCCGCSCYALRFAEYFRTPDVVRSNFTVKVDKEKCVACGQCVENCQVNAIKLGARLCSSTPVNEEAVETPRDNIWGKDRYNVEYRFNRTDVTDEGTAPCKVQCPAHIPVQGYIKLAAQGKYQEALELIKKDNPFPAVCGRVCNKKCEDACTRGDLDEPIAIDDIKKFIAEQDLKAGNRFVPPLLNQTGKPYTNKIAVIGAGPAGLTCAYYLANKGYPVTVFEKENKLGGMLTLGIPSFRLEKDVVNAEIDVLKDMGVNFQTGVEVGKDITLEKLRSEGFEAFYIAIGCQGGRKIGVPGEDAQGVYSGVDFVRQVNLGNATNLEGRTIVIGGGNVAVDVARTAVRSASSEVSMYCLESRDIMPAAAEEVEEAEAEGISVNPSWGPKEILVENGKVKAVVFKKCTAVFDAQKRFNPTYDENDTITVECENVLLSIGQSILWGDMLKGSKIQLNGNNTVKADAVTYQTSQPDVFVGGDVYTGPKFAIDAIAAGKEGAISIHRYVHDGQDLLIGRDRKDYKSMIKSNYTVDISCFDNSERQKPAAADAANAKKSFNDLRGVFTEEQLKKETERCLGCGAAVVDTHMCVGCGICVTKCKFDALKMEKVYDKHGKPYFQTLGNVAGYAAKRAGKIAVKKIGEAIK